MPHENYTVFLLKPEIIGVRLLKVKTGNILLKCALGKYIVTL